MYEGGSLDDGKSELKALLRHQICTALKNRDTKGYKIELINIWKQSMIIGYLEVKNSDNKIKSNLTITRFYVYKLYRKFGYTEKALRQWIAKLFEIHNNIPLIYIKQFEEDRELTNTILNSGFKLCKNIKSDYQLLQGIYHYVWKKKEFIPKSPFKAPIFKKDSKFCLSMRKRRHTKENNEYYKSEMSSRNNFKAISQIK